MVQDLSKLKRIATVLTTQIMTEFSLFWHLKRNNKNLKEGVDWKRVGLTILTRIHKLQQKEKQRFTLAALEHSKKKKKMAEKIKKNMKISNQCCFNYS